MKKTLILIVALLSFTVSACSNMNVPKPNMVKAKLTLYTPHEDKYGARVACPKIKRAKQGETVAMERAFPFGTRVIIPGMKNIIGDNEFFVQDRGTAVERRVASRGAYPVIDIFVNKSNKTMRRLAANMPQGAVDVYVELPNRY